MPFLEIGVQVASDEFHTRFFSHLFSYLNNFLLLLIGGDKQSSGKGGNREFNCSLGGAGKTQTIAIQAPLLGLMGFNLFQKITDIIKIVIPERIIIILEILCQRLPTFQIFTVRMNVRVEPIYVWLVAHSGEDFCGLN